MAKYTFKLGINTKTRAFFTNQHLATMIHFHICKHESLRELNQGMTEQMKDLFLEISLSTLSNHNNNRDYRVFLPILDQLITSNTACHDCTQTDSLITEKGTIYICDKGYVDYKSLIATLKMISIL